MTGTSFWMKVSMGYLRRGSLERWHGEFRALITGGSLGTSHVRFITRQIRESRLWLRRMAKRCLVLRSASLRGSMLKTQKQIYQTKLYQKISRS